MNPWAEVEQWRVAANRREGIASHLAPSKDSIRHARIESRAWRYLKRNGEVVALHEGEFHRIRDWSRVTVVALCSDPLDLPWATDGHRNRLTSKLTLVTCMRCRVELDRAMEAGRLKVDESMWFSRVTDGEPR